MLINVGIIEHDVKASVNNLPVFWIIDEISNLVPAQGIRISIFYDSGRFLFQVRTYMI